MANLAKFGGRAVADLAKIMGLDVPAAGALAEDILNSAADYTTAGDVASGGGRYWTLAATTQVDLKSCTTVFDANSLAVGVGVSAIMAQTANTMKTRLYMDGEEVAESAYIPTTVDPTIVLMATRALSGSKIIKVSLYNYNGSSKLWYMGGKTGAVYHVAIAAGSIKLV